MTFAQRRNRLTTLFSESIPVVKRRMTVLKGCKIYCVNEMKYDRHNTLGKRKKDWVVCGQYCAIFSYRVSAEQ